MPIVKAKERNLIEEVLTLVLLIINDNYSKDKLSQWVSYASVNINDKEVKKVIDRVLFMLSDLECGKVDKENCAEIFMMDLESIYRDYST